MSEVDRTPPSVCFSCSFGHALLMAGFEEINNRVIICLIERCCYLFFSICPISFCIRLLLPPFLSFTVYFSSSLSLSASLFDAHTVSLHLLVKWCSFLLVVIKSKVGPIREPVFESGSGCQRAFVPQALDVQLMASLSLSCLPTMPLLIHQPITTIRNCGPQNAFSFVECV